jgi:uncharacterized membrane-anchored protein
VSKLGPTIASKVPHVTLAFWIIKLLATTVGETGGDAVSMTLDLGYAVASLIYVTFFAVALTIQVASRSPAALRGSRSWSFFMRA